MKIVESIQKKLTDTFTPTHLHIEDHSHLHAGHAQNTGTTETHFKIEIISAAFDGVSLVKRHQLIYKCLDHELKNGVHALQIDARPV